MRRSLLLVHQLELLYQLKEAAARAVLSLPLLEESGVVVGGVGEYSIQSSAYGWEHSGRLVAHSRTVGEQLRVAQERGERRQRVTHVSHGTALIPHNKNNSNTQRA